MMIGNVYVLLSVYHLIIIIIIIIKCILVDYHISGI